MAAEESGVLPEWMGTLGDELGQAWPFFLALVGIGIAVKRWAWPALLEHITEAVNETGRKVVAGRVMADRQVVRKLDEVKSEFTADGNGNMRTQMDRIEGLVRDLARTSNHMGARILALQSTGDALYEIDASGKLTHVTAGFVELYGSTYGEIMNQGWDQFIAPEHRARITASAVAAVEGRTPWFERFTIVRKDGQRIKVQARGFPIVCVDGEFFGYAGALIRESETET